MAKSLSDLLAGHAEPVDDTKEVRDANCRRPHRSWSSSTMINGNAVGSRPTCFNGLGHRGPGVGFPDRQARHLRNDELAVPFR